MKKPNFCECDYLDCPIQHCRAGGSDSGKVGKGRCSTAHRRVGGRPQLGRTDQLLLQGLRLRQSDNRGSRGGRSDDFQNQPSHESKQLGMAAIPSQMEHSSDLALGLGVTLAFIQLLAARPIKPMISGRPSPLAESVPLWASLLTSSAEGLKSCTLPDRTSLPSCLTPVYTTPVRGRR